MKTESDRRLLTAKEVAKEFSLSEAWIRDHVTGRRKPLLPHIRLGDRRGQLRFRRSDIDKFLTQHTRNSS